MQFRTIDASEREAVLDLLGEWEGESREAFARTFAHDPTFRDDLCFVAADGGRIVSTVQVLRKRVRLGGAALDVAGIANVFTTASHRERGLANRLLRLALDAMPEHGFDLSLLFATRLEFYGALGWRPLLRQWAFVHAPGSPPPPTEGLRPFVPSDLGEIRQLYDAYCGDLPGTTVRDDAYWAGQLHTAGNPTEDFWVAHRGGELVAYARGTRIYGLYAVVEHAYRRGHAAALATLVQRLFGAEARGEIGVATQLGVAPDVLATLEAAGHRIDRVDDHFWMGRMVGAAATAAKLGRGVAEVEHPDFLQRLLAPEQSVYWIADRF